MFVGCKDGTLLEVNCKTFKVEREMENDLPIQSIIVYEDGMLILAHSIQSGYLEDRSVVQVVKPNANYRFESVAMVNLAETGNINEIILNPMDDDELIIAC